jgi:cell division septum initiation protein DivIVA
MSAVELTNAADALDREVRRLEHFTAAAKKLRELGSLEQACEEAQKRLDALKSDETAAVERVAALNQAADHTNELLDQAKASHLASRKAIDEAVDRRAKDITEAATTQAQQIVGDARIDAEATVKTAKDYADAIAKDAADMKAAVAVGAKRVADLQAEYESLSARLDEARQAAKQIMGAK